MRTTWTSTVACWVTRSVRALARARSMRSQVPSVTYRWASASIAAQARQASSEGNVPSQVSTPGSSTHRRRLDSDRARCARWRSRSGLIRASVRRARRRRRAESSTPNHPSNDATTVAATSGGHSSSSAATTCARYASSTPDAIAACNPPSPVHDVRAVGAVGRGPQRVPDPAFSGDRRQAQHPREDRRGVQRPVPERLVHLDEGAVLTPLRLDRRQPHDRRVLRCRRLVHQALELTGHRRPLLPRPPHPIRFRDRGQGTTGDTHRVQHVLRTDRGDHGLPLPSYPRSYPRPPTRTSVRTHQFRWGAGDVLSRRRPKGTSVTTGSRGSAPWGSGGSGARRRLAGGRRIRTREDGVEVHLLGGRDRAQESAQVSDLGLDREVGARRAVVDLRDDGVPVRARARGEEDEDEDHVDPGLQADSGVPVVPRRPGSRRRRARWRRRAGGGHGDSSRQGATSPPIAGSMAPRASATRCGTPRRPVAATSARPRPD